MDATLAVISERFHRAGWVHVPRLFGASLMTRLNRVVRNRYGDAPDRQHDAAFIENAEVDVVPWFPQREGVSAFDSLENDPILRSITSAILGRPWREDYVMAMFSTKNGVGQAWHQDSNPVRADQYNLNRLVYPHDIDPEHGGELVIVPGSHQRGRLAPGDGHEDFPGQVVIAPKAGDLVLVHGHAWHRVRPSGEATRVSVNLRALPDTAPDDVTDVCVYRNMRYRFSTGEVLERL